MNNTPETDAAAFDAFDGQGGEVVFAAFASQLERERNNLQDQRDFCMGEIARLKQERDEARVQYRSTEALAMALVKTIDELKAEKAAIYAQLVSLQAGSRRATLDEIAESVREKYDERYEGEEIEN